MIIKENYYEEHIRELQTAVKGDPRLIERTLYAFGLLEALVAVGMDFTFKGGTSLLLLLSKPKRLSTDIDIVVEPSTDVDKFIIKASHIFPFLSMEEQKRRNRDVIVKRHFKFTYNSPINRSPLYILLDVLYETNAYEKIVEKKIENDLLLTEGDNLAVKIPSLDCILGDKMTAFAPYTTGIPLRQNRDLEVMKQFYDICTLIEEISCFEDVLSTYCNIVRTETNYRGGKYTPAQVLEDTIKAASCIGSRGKIAPEDFPSYVKGSRDIVNHIYGQKFSMEKAALMAPKLIHMAACILTRQPFIKIKDSEFFKNESLTQDDLKYMKNFRKLRDTSYAHLVQADRLLNEYRNC